MKIIKQYNVKISFTILSYVLYVYRMTNYNFEIFFNFGPNWLRTARFNSFCALRESTILISLMLLAYSPYTLTALNFVQKGKSEFFNTGKMND
jgi:hypothetical protein